VMRFRASSEFGRLPVTQRVFSEECFAHLFNNN
jgi:hypothetical protein